MSDLELVIGVLFLAVLCLAVVTSAGARSDGRGRRTHYKGLKPRPVAKAVEGLFSVVGTVVPADRSGVTSPLTGHQAVGYSIRVKATCLEDRRITWDTSVEQVGDFLLQDDAGDRLLVRGADAHIRLHGRDAPATTEDLTGCAPEPLHAAFRDQRGNDELLERTLAAGGERLLRSGDRVRVYGEVAWQADASLSGPGFRGTPGALCLAAPRDEQDVPLLIVPLKTTTQNDDSEQHP